jgi:hypothetical protein
MQPPTGRPNRFKLRVISLAILPTLLAAGPLGIDHVTIAGRDLKAMRARLAAVGIESQYGGPHSNHATEMALVSFPDGSYLELMGVQADADAQAVAAHYWAKQLEGDAGPCAWAMRSRDVAAEAKRLAAAGVVVSEPLHSGRTRPDGVRLDWQTARVGPEPNGTFFPFLIQDFTERALRAFPTGKPTTSAFQGVAKVVIAVRDLDGAVSRFRQAYGLPAPLHQADPGFQARLASFDGTPVVLAGPSSAQSWLNERLEKFGQGPCAFILAAPNASAFHAAGKTRWFGVEVSWFDAEKLGWRLGWE